MGYRDFLVIFRGRWVEIRDFVGVIWLVNCGLVEVYILFLKIGSGNLIFLIWNLKENYEILIGCLDYLGCYFEFFKILENCIFFIVLFCGF